MCFSFCQVELPKKIVVIDPGHGGKDTGAIGVHGVLEKEVVLKIAKEILNHNHLILDDRIEVYLTRYKDTLISLSDRAMLASELKSDLFISLHCNAAITGASGMEIFVADKDNPHMESSVQLATSVLGESGRKLGIRERGVKVGNFQVQRETMDFCPTILIETGFVTHVDEGDYYQKPRNIKAVALAILLGIYNYLKSED
ncbi:N-acetylmuramoyl-L-alanine amidase [Arenibacter palladensis]|uniref:N-acetylmuramoyl-L-alanine amidase family protein n=1 Tax=Arenibacter palladensis TaxID=237373 RepID=UPI002FD40ED9